MGLWIATNNGPVHAYASVGAASDKDGVILVQLRGIQGNPTAVGARITLHRPDGSKQVREVHAGEGYLTQNPATVRLDGVTPNCRIDVAWPDGAQTQHPVSATKGRVTLTR